MYKIAICDDNASFMEELKRGIAISKEFDNTMKIGMFHSGMELLKAPVESYSLVIIDVQMEGLGGFETAREVRKRNKDILLAFTSGMTMPQPEHFKVQPYRYLIKSVDSGKFDEVIAELLSEMKARAYKNIVEVANDGEAWKIYTDDILYIQKRKRGCLLKVAEHSGGSIAYRDVLSNEKLEQWYQQLDTSGFEYAHSSYIVNMKHVSMVAKDLIGLSNGDVLRISRACKPVFTERYSHYFSKKYKRNQLS